MNVDVIRGNDLRRERWTFLLKISGGNFVLYLDYYFNESKTTTRKRLWHMDSFWSRFFNPRSEFHPPIPEDVVSEARIFFAEKIKGLALSEPK